LNTGLLFLFFLVPLGYAVLVTGSLGSVFTAAIITNIIYTIITSSSNNINSGILIGIIYFTVLLFGYLWIVGGSNLRTLYRFLLASIAGTIAFLIVINRNDLFFHMLFTELVNDFSLNIRPEEMQNSVKNILFRGGALVSMSFLFFINRQAAFSIFQYINKQKKDNGLTKFLAPINTIWFFSGATATIFLTMMFQIQLLEIISWNVLIICVIIFAMQGLSVFIYLISGRSASFRLIISATVIFLMLTPLSLIAVLALLVLGVTESFRPIRVQSGTAQAV